MNNKLSVAIFYANQCDPKKCTSIRLSNMQNKLNIRLHWLTHPKQIHQQSIVLTPNSYNILIPADEKYISKKGITIIDCSWKQGQKYLAWTFTRGRKLPPLLAGNPVNYGKWYRLTSAEALAASLFIINKPQEAHEILDILPWGKSFVELNHELLQTYAKIKSQKEVKDRFREFYPEQKLMG